MREGGRERERKKGRKRKRKSRKINEGLGAVPTCDNHATCQ